MTIGIVQSWGGGSGKVLTYTSPASSAALTPGNWLVYFCNCAFGSDPLITCSETSGNGISPSAGLVSSAPQINGSYYYAWAVPIVTGGATSALSVGNPVSGGQYYTIGGVEVSGVGSVRTNAGTIDTNFPTTHAGVTLPGLQAGDAIICGFGDIASSTTEAFGAGAGFTILTPATILGSANTYNPAGVQYNLAPSASQACGWTTSVNVQSSTIAIALAAASIIVPALMGQILT